MSRRSQRIYWGIVWAVAIVSSYYAAWRHLDARQHVLGAIASIVLLWVILLVVDLVGRRKSKADRGGA